MNAPDAAEQFQIALRDYALFTGRQQGPLIEDRARKVRFELFRGFKAIAKNAASLKAEIASLGYAIKRRVDGALAAEYPFAAAVGAVPRVSNEEEIKLRVRSLRFLSVSFLIKGWKSSADKGQQARFDALNRAGVKIGSAHVDTAVGKTNPFVSLTSLLAGVVDQNQKRNIADRALAAQARDMNVYLERKHDEELKQLFGGALKNVTTALA